MCTELAPQEAGAAQVPLSRALLLRTAALGCPCEPKYRAGLLRPPLPWLPTVREQP